MSDQPAQGSSRRARRSSSSGPDRVVVGLGSVTAFLIVLAVLAGQLRAAPAQAPVHRQLIIRRIYATTIVEDPSGSPAARSTVTQSVSTSGSTPGSAATPTTRTSSSSRGG